MNSTRSQGPVPTEGAAITPHSESKRSVVPQAKNSITYGFNRSSNKAAGKTQVQAGSTPISERLPSTGSETSQPPLIKANSNLVPTPNDKNEFFVLGVRNDSFLEDFVRLSERSCVYVNCEYGLGEGGGVCGEGGLIGRKVLEARDLKCKERESKSNRVGAVQLVWCSHYSR